jgi:uncharacterized membrane protein
MSFLVLKWLHVLGATVLFGTGAGIAFFLLRAHRTRNAQQVAAVHGSAGHCCCTFWSAAAGCRWCGCN